MKQYLVRGVTSLYEGSNGYWRWGNGVGECFKGKRQGYDSFFFNRVVGQVNEKTEGS